MKKKGCLSLYIHALRLSPVFLLASPSITDAHLVRACIQPMPLLSKDPVSRPDYHPIGFAGANHDMAVIFLEGRRRLTECFWSHGGKAKTCLARPEGASAQQGVFLSARC